MTYFARYILAADAIWRHVFQGVVKLYVAAYLSKTDLPIVLVDSRGVFSRKICLTIRHLRIEQRHFDAVAHHLRTTLEEFSVPDGLISAIMDRIGVLASEIVNTPSRMPVAADSHADFAASFASSNRACVVASIQLETS